VYSSDKSIDDVYQIRKSTEKNVSNLAMHSIVFVTNIQIHPSLLQPLYLKFFHSKQLFVLRTHFDPGLSSTYVFDRVLLNSKLLQLFVYVVKI
jgi:hypothetical protein